jgi:hypothetical protein
MRNCSLTSSARVPKTERNSGTLVEVVEEFATDGISPKCDCAWRTPMHVWWGAVAQLGERLVRNEEVSGSIPLSSTKESITCGMGSESGDTFVSLFVS